MAYVDGSFKEADPKKGTSKQAGIGAFFTDSDELDIGIQECRVFAELSAIYYGLKKAIDIGYPSPILVFSDSRSNLDWLYSHTPKRGKRNDTELEYHNEIKTMISNYPSTIDLIKLASADNGIADMLAKAGRSLDSFRYIEAEHFDGNFVKQIYEWKYGLVLENLYIK